MKPKLPKGHKSWFRYTTAAATDVAKTFKRLRDAQRKAEKDTARTIVPMKGHSHDKR